MGTVQTIAVLVMLTIVQILFMASPIKTLVESLEAKLRPVIVMLYPPPIGPEEGETLLTNILYLKREPGLGKEMAVPALPLLMTLT